MEQEDQYTLELKEGSVRNYIELLEQTFGGTRTTNAYDYKKGLDKIHISHYNILDDLELALLEVNLSKALNVHRQPDERTDFYHLTFIKEGHIERDYQNKELEDADTTKGLFIHNGLFALSSHYPANLEMRSLSVKFSRKALLQIIPEANDLLQSLFPDDEPRGYHTNALVELENMVRDIYFFEKAAFGSKALVIGRSLELFTQLLGTIKNQQEKNSLNGLHYDDYQRLLDIKHYILSHLDRKLNIEDITNEFGLSDSKLKRDFKALFNSSVYQFYTHAKMDEAYRRLKSGQYTVTQVGFDLGYNSLSKFSEMFKKVKGINPKDVVPL
ncbi:helix-turn-helix transcriptional regulator [Carboxylicivirga sediminis]|uniref:Helix-turn-helix transcriptional regulator n=1 Tax=Carboxylicivirga sediminis TaxID=2006564 RepID=A0A941F0G8_9BACT|nr:AraC family transcriptional regulator [Carboxylicivirga sediminis]MBR8534083.1 helix-turn-helix transcriptional regulator [Carboxylicivirga sediminis]